MEELQDGNAAVTPPIEPVTPVQTEIIAPQVPAQSVEASADPEAQARAKAELAVLMHKYGLGEENQAAPEEQHKFLRGYSWAGLIYSVVYYWAMGDWLFVFISAVVSIVFV
ncbi:MAG TPA: hypothetical protein VMQ44_03970, partial [Candidatus Saccharimonadales bacterium]|nr:hypothetical protein [Candidatus Saccharimonadales bacterium]